MVFLLIFQLVSGMVFLPVSSLTFRLVSGMVFLLISSLAFRPVSGMVFLLISGLAFGLLLCRPGPSAAFGSLFSFTVLSSGVFFILHPAPPAKENAFGSMDFLSDKSGVRHRTSGFLNSFLSRS